jgi:hypothetical protein
MTRDDYVAALKKQLDQWNAEVERWEGKAREAGSGVKAGYEKQLLNLRQERDKAMEQMRQVQASSGEAWKTLMRGTDDAWTRMREAFDKARDHFKK